jgi:hypothetical protein
MKSTFFWCICAASIFLVGAAQANDSWQKIGVAPGQYNVTVGNEEKLINPSCALGQPYSFHFKPGNQEKLVVYYNSGGACWDSNTCVGSLTSGNPVFIPSAEIANDPAVMGGILDVNNPQNPYANWSMLFISYCTGDVHVGSTDTVYQNPLPPNNRVTIHHRGFDNFLYAINWLKDNHPEIDPDKIVVAGSSAGSYGATLNYPTVKEFYPDADNTFGIGDAGMGVIRDANEFVNASFGEPSTWNARETLHPIFTSLPDAVIAHPENFLSNIYNLLSAAYPKDKFAQYTTAYDAAQIFFWDIMLNPDTPEFWGAGLSDPYFIGEWNFEMNTITGNLRASLPQNYRSYIGPGCNHTILSNNDDFYSSSLTSSTGQAITFLQWLTAMTEEKNAVNNNWQNLSCTPGGGCGEENLNADGINACMARTS